MAAEKNRGFKGRLFAPALVGAVHLAACGGSGEEAPPPQAPQSAPAPTAPPAMTETAPAAPTAAAPAEPAAPPAPALDAPVVITGFMTPESVLYDATNDVYLVSNINGKPTDVDGNGFISKVTPDGKVAELKWIDGSKKATALDAPKGLAIAKGTLYVADLTVVRMFDLKTGKAKGKVAAAGSTFLNDISVAPDGTVYVSDTGLKAGKDGLEPDGTDAIYKIGKKGTAEKLIAGKELGGPNGVLADDKGVWAVTFATGELYHVGTDGKKEPGQKLPQAALDGIVKLADGSLAISSWAASAVYKGTPGGTFEIFVTGLKSPADIGYDTKRNTLLIPMFLADSVALQKLPGAPAAETAPAPETKATPAAGSAAAKGGAPAVSKGADSKASPAMGAAAAPSPAGGSKSAPAMGGATTPGTPASTGKP